MLPSQASMQALIMEGELDALVAWQEVSHRVNVVTIGGSEQAPQPEALASCLRWLIATDHDEAGDQAARRIAALAPHKARRVILSSGKDLGDFVQGGGDVTEWLDGEMDRLGIAPTPWSTPAMPR